MEGPQSRLDAGVVVLGGGASGSWAVRALAAAGFCGRVVLVDDGSVPIEDRVWASWVATGSEPATDPDVPGWHQLVVAGQTGEHLLVLHDSIYVAVRGTQVREAADAALRRLGGVRLDARAIHLHDNGRYAVVDTTAGTLRARYVLDSVSLLEPAPAPSRVQMAFTGWEVEVDGPAFDATRVRLMDFRVPQHDAVTFAYLVPWSSNRALVELTRFGAAPRPTDDDLAAYVSGAVHDIPFRVVRRESSTLPLRVQRGRPRRGGCLAIGTGAGLVRASTGFGYERMRRDSVLLASDIVAGRRPVGLRPRLRHLALDATFQELVVSDPAMARTAVEDLFTRNPTDLVLRFLDGSTTLADEARLAMTLPTSPFAAAALRTAGHAAAPHRQAGTSTWHAA